jgi:hypothetical protein
MAVILWYWSVMFALAESFSLKGENGVPAVPVVTGATESYVPLLLAKSMI